jgi:nitroreductase/NAD-dependent dihydropyrimidine dehydrogenase PreA subunit
MKMVEIIIDADVCKKDGLCAMTCPISLIVQNGKGTIPTIRDDRDGCFRCGQCVAVCPHGAISHSHFPEGTVTPIRAEEVATYDQVLGLIRSRRSQRSFKDKVVEQDLIEKVLDAARFGPSGHNEQSTEFVVVQDKETIVEIGRLTAKGLKKTGVPFNYAIGRMMMRTMIGKRGAEYLGELAPEFIGLADMYNDGEDLILHDAPALILFCADSVGGTFAGTNANIALHNAALAAETLGLGCFYTGFVVIVSERDDSIARLVGLPETHNIYGALAVGYPRLKFKQWPERNPAKVTWVSAN